MERHRHAGPADMGLSSRLFPATPGCPAYGSAVAHLRLIPLETCPRRKLDCIGAGPCCARAGVGAPGWRGGGLGRQGGRVTLHTRSVP